MGWVSGWVWAGGVACAAQDLGKVARDQPRQGGYPEEQASPPLVGPRRSAASSRAASRAAATPPAAAARLLKKMSEIIETRCALAVAQLSCR